jgi:hypothetical protein
VIATSVSATWLAILFVFGTVATLFWFGVRAPIHPPDPDWREHQPRPERVPRSYLLAWGIVTGLFYTLMLLVLVTSITHARWLTFVAVGALIVSSVARLVIARKIDQRSRQSS